MAKLPIEPPDPFTRQTINCKHCFVKDPESGLCLTLADKAKDGTRVELRPFTGADNQKFVPKLWGERGWSLGTRQDEWQVVCTSRSDFSSNREYDEPGHPLWLWAWLNGSNQFWDLSRRYRPNSFVITNVQSGLHMYADGVDGHPVIPHHRETRWELFPDTVALELVNVQCIRPSTATIINANLVADLTTALGFTTGALGLATVAASTLVQVSVAGASFVVSSAALGAWIAGHIDSGRPADDLYIQAGGLHAVRRVWPADGGEQQIRGGTTVSAALAIAHAAGTYAVQLWDDDAGGDDLVGEHVFDLSVFTPKGRHDVLVGKAAHDSLYRLTFSVA